MTAFVSPRAGSISLRVACCERCTAPRVGLSGTGRSRRSFLTLVGMAIVGVSALLLFCDLISAEPTALWRTLSGSRNQTSEQERDKALLETRQPLVFAHGEIETLNGEIETLNRDRARVLTGLTRTTEEKKVEGARALAAGGEAVGAAEAKSVEQQEALGREREEAERLRHDLAAARTEIEALKAEGARALAAGGEAVRAAEAKSVEQQEALGREEAERLRHDL